MNRSYTACSSGSVHRWKINNLHTPESHTAGYQLRLLVADTDLGNADRIRTGAATGNTVCDRRDRPLVEG